MAYTIGYGAAADGGDLQQIERAAGARFRTIGMGDIADHDPTSLEDFEDCAKHRRLLVARDASKAIAAFLVWTPRDRAAYIEEVASDPAHAGNRLGAKLIDRLAADIQGHYIAVTLATFRDVPWNAPYYARLGFVECTAQSLGHDHEEAQREQAEHLDMSKRLFMVRRL